MSDATARDPFERHTLVRELEVIVQAGSLPAAREVVLAVGTVQATSGEDAVTVRLRPNVTYSEAVRQLHECPVVRAIYCHHPVVAGWKSSRPLPPEARRSYDAAVQDFAAVDVSDRVAKGEPP